MAGHKTRPPREVERIRMAAYRAEHPLYARWQSIKQRCLNQNHARFKDYGGRGITLWPAWAESFAQFERDLMNLPYAMWGERSIDRVNNDGNYEPGNLRWATPAQQRRNQYRSPGPFGVLEGAKWWGTKEQTYDEWAEEQASRELAACL